MDMKNKGDFKKNVLNIVSKIPKGSVLTYKEVSILAGSPYAYRCVGNILSRNYDSSVPCHRVIKSNGSAGLYNRGEKQKLKLLREEGVANI